MSDSIDIQEKVFTTGKTARTQLHKYSQKIILLSQKFASIPLLTSLSIAKNIRHSDSKHGSRATSPIAETHIDLLHGVICANHLVPLKRANGTLQEAQSLLGYIKITPLAYIYSQWSEDDHRETQRQRRARMHLENTILRRNWGYIDDVQEISSELIQPLSGYLHQHLGVKVGLLPCILDYINQKSVELMSIVSKKYADGTYNFTSQDQAFLELLFQQETQELQDYLIICPHKLGAVLDESESEISMLLDSLCLTPGENIVDITRSLHTNPVWLNPFIKLEDGRYFISSAHILSSNILDIYRKFASVKKYTMDTYDKRYQDYLEEKVFSLLSRPFKRSQIHKNCHIYGRSDLQGESDTIIKIDNFLFVFEAKAHQFDSAAKRGSLNNINTYYKKSISTGIKQAKKSIQHIFEAVNEAKFRVDGEVIEIDGKTINNFIKVIIIYPDFGLISGNPFHYHDEKYITDRDNMVMSLVDLKILTEILQNPIELIDYFNNRKIINKNINVASDEMDFLGVYLENRLDNLINRGGEGYVFRAPEDCDEKIDIYKDEKVFKKIDHPPKHSISNLWQEIIKQAHIEESKGYIDFCLCLLRVSFKEQLNEEYQISLFHKKLKRLSSREEVFSTGRWIKEIRKGYIFFVYSGHLSSKRSNQINQTIKSIHKNQKLDVDTIYVIKIDVKTKYIYESFECIQINAD